MTDSKQLTHVEKQWLLAVSRGPLKKESAERCIPMNILQRLIAIRLVRWELDSLSITAKGESAAMLLRSMRD